MESFSSPRNIVNQLRFSQTYANKIKREEALMFQQLSMFYFNEKAKSITIATPRPMALLLYFLFLQRVR